MAISKKDQEFKSLIDRSIKRVFWEEDLYDQSLSRYMAQIGHLYDDFSLISLSNASWAITLLFPWDRLSRFKIDNIPIFKYLQLKSEDKILPFIAIKVY